MNETTTVAATAGAATVRVIPCFDGGARKSAAFKKGYTLKVENLHAIPFS